MSHVPSLAYIIHPPPNSRPTHPACTIRCTSSHCTTTTQLTYSLATHCSKIIKSAHASSPKIPNQQSTPNPQPQIAPATQNPTTSLTPAQSIKIPGLFFFYIFCPYTAQVLIFSSNKNLPPLLPLYTLFSTIIPYPARCCCPAICTLLSRSPHHIDPSLPPPAALLYGDSNQHLQIKKIYTLTPHQ